MLVKIHRALAVILGLFVLTHLGVHMAAFGGPDAHERALDVVRVVYRNRFIEPILILAALTQIIAGARLAARRWREAGKGFWGWAQIVSGVYLGAFLLLHFSAALAARHLGGIETNFYWPAGTLTVGPLPYFFAPYYFMAVVAIFTHLAAAVHFHFGERAWGRLAPKFMIGAGALLGAFLVSVFSGVFFAFDLPPAYQGYYGNYVALFPGR
ncbi:MAG: hypothetical protein R3C40_11060 [Parvularculaceae bacterium]